LYDGAEGEASTGIIPLGKWNNAAIGGAANTGQNSYESLSAGFTPSLQLSSEAKSKLKKNTTYYLSMYLRSQANNSPTIEIRGEKNIEIASKKVTLNANYTKVDILVKNSENNPVNQIVINPNSTNHSINWDDVTITEVSAMKPKDFSNDDIKKIYKDYTEVKNGSYLDAVTFKNIKPLQNYVTKYRVKNRSAIPGLGVIPIDKTLDSGPVNNNGDVKVNLRDYSSNGINTAIEKVDIYAITNDGREILIYSS
ncbi:hypothetical protein SBO61_30705, partial [Bacillus thuringiensis]|nr:hypothetical protein [Bacillus thuringiensis]